MFRRSCKDVRSLREFTLPSTCGASLHCGLWAPNTLEPAAVLQLVHGVSEHIGRYEDFGCFLADNGVLTVADDHMGHGRSAGETPGFFPSGWFGAVDDELTLMKRVREEYPDTPYFLLGHSMGSFLTRSFLIRHSDAPLKGALLSGTGWQSPLTLKLGLRLCAREEKRAGEREVSDMLQKVVFGSYNRAFGKSRTPNDWICSDPKVVDAYCADPLCAISPTIGLSRDMLGGMLWNEDKKNLRKMNKDIPVFFFSGARDPVGKMGKGVLRSVKAFRGAGMREVDCKLYPGGRHEMLNEPNRREVYGDILHWLRAHIDT